MARQQRRRWEEEKAALAEVAGTQVAVATGECIDITT